MNSVHFSDWLIHSLQKDLFKDPIQQEIADKIIKSMIENSTNIKKSHHEKKRMKLILQSKHLKFHGTTACVKFIQLKICILEAFRQI